MEWSFKLPVSVGGGGEFVMRELTVMEAKEIRQAALVAAGDDKAKLAKAMDRISEMERQRAIVRWKLKDIPAGEAEAWYYSLTPREREVYEIAFRRVHSVSKDEADWILESMEPAGKVAGAAS